MPRTHDQRPETGPDYLQQSAPYATMTAAQYGGGRPAFIVDSAGVATPGNLVRGDGFTMRNGDVWPPRRPRRRDMN
jgi:hypothetical protein